ncbi:MAG: stage V sporulation protein AB [Roseburia sp.]|nr:stage V sporulation protein AB [Roseburia sp.]MCM1097657.1 stage V sporulation protein AB [Ruminococcus flavefaciens]
MRTLFLIIFGMSYGLLAAAGVFTVLVAVGLIPRFAGKTHTAGRAVLYEEMVIFGTLTGSFLSIFTRYCQFGAWWQERFPGGEELLQGIGGFCQGIFGLFAGMFIGCLALAIAEMLDSIPIFARRISFRHGIGLAVLSMAAGKLCGSLFYFWAELHRTAG